MSTSIARERYHHGDLRAALVGAAREIIDERGADEFSLREAARAVDVSPSATYRHFADRAALLDAVVDEEFARFGERLRVAAARAQSDVRDPAAAAVAALAAFGRVHVESAGARPRMFRAMFGARRGHPGPHEHDVQTAVMGTLMDLVATGAVDPQRFPRVNLAAWPAFHGLACLVADQQIPPEEVPAALAAVTATVLSGAGVPDQLLEAAGVPMG